MSIPKTSWINLQIKKGSVLQSAFMATDLLRVLETLHWDCLICSSKLFQQMSTHLVWWTALSNTNTFLFWHLWTGWNSRPSLHDAAQILPLLGDIQRHCISRLSFTISYANKVIKINRCLETCQYWGKACNAINIFPENMDNHTEILLNTFKSVAYDDNWALQHEKCAFKSTTQLKQKTVDLYFLMHCSSDFRGRRCPKMHFRPENNCSKEYACEVYIFKVWAEDWAGLLPSF